MAAVMTATAKIEAAPAERKPIRAECCAIESLNLGGSFPLGSGDRAILILSCAYTIRLLKAEIFQR